VIPPHHRSLQQLEVTRQEPKDVEKLLAGSVGDLQRDEGGARWKSGRERDREARLRVGLWWRRGVVEAEMAQSGAEDGKRVVALQPAVVVGCPAAVEVEMGEVRCRVEKNFERRLG